MAFLRYLVCLIAFIVTLNECAHILQKRNYIGQGCMGTYNRSKYARLDAVCEECYELFREPDIHGRCKHNCFKNEDFNKCVRALLLEDEQEDLDSSIDSLYYGKRK